MKQHNPNVMRTLSFAFGVIAALALLIGFLVRPEHSSEITQTFDYTASEENAYPENIPETIEQDGKTYVKVEQPQPEVTVIGQSQRYTETVTIEDLPSEQAPETRQSSVNGKVVTLILQSADYTPVTKQYEATGEVRFENQTSQPDIPEYSEITYENDAGNLVTVEGKLQSVDTVGANGTSQTVTSTISLPAGATTFKIGEKTITYNENSPLWEGYQQDVLNGLKLDKGRYTVTGGRWSSEPYYEGNTMKRDVTWTIQSTGASTYIATYYAAGEKTFYTANAVYGAEISEIGLNASEANDIEYSLSAKVTYRGETAGGESLANSFPTIPVVMGIVALTSTVLSVCCLKKATKNDKVPHSESPDTGEAEFPENQQDLIWEQTPKDEDGKTQR